MRVAVIPARGGSKRIPRKNIKEFHGVPMLVRAIRLLQDSKCFDEIHVSTEDEEIAQLARNSGALCSKLRPKELSGDLIGIDDVMRAFCKEKELVIDEQSSVMCLFPCTPLIETEDLIKIVNIHLKNPIALTFPVAKFPSSPARALLKKSGYKYTFKYPENRFKRSQDFPSHYFDTGQCYITVSRIWKSSSPKDFVCDEIAQWKAIDIDNEEDWEFAELIHHALISRRQN